MTIMTSFKINNFLVSPNTQSVFDFPSYLKNVFSVCSNKAPTRTTQYTRSQCFLGLSLSLFLTIFNFHVVSPVIENNILIKNTVSPTLTFHATILFQRVYI